MQRTWMNGLSRPSIRLCASVLFTLVLIVLPTAVRADYAWEGIAVRGAAGTFPEEGVYAASNVVPRNSIVEITSLETGRSVRAIVARRSEEPGVLIQLSSDAAESLQFSDDERSLRVIVEPISVPGLSGRSIIGEPPLSADPDLNPLARVPAPRPVPVPETAEREADRVADEPGEPGEPGERIEPDEPTEPIEPDEPIEPVHPIEDIDIPEESFPSRREIAVEDPLPLAEARPSVDVEPSPPRPDRPAGPDRSFVAEPGAPPRPDSGPPMVAPARPPLFVVDELPEPDLRLADPEPDMPEYAEEVVEEEPEVDRLAGAIDRAVDRRLRYPATLFASPVGEHGPDDIARGPTTPQVPEVSIVDEPHPTDPRLVEAEVEVEVEVEPAEEEREPGIDPDPLPRLVPTEVELPRIADRAEVPEDRYRPEETLSRAEPEPTEPGTPTDEPEEPRFVLDDLLDPRPEPPAITDRIVTLEPAEPRPPEITEVPRPTPEPLIEDDPEDVMVTEPAPDRDHELPTVMHLETGAYYLQIGAWSSPENARRSVQRLESSFPTVVNTVETPDRTLYRVLVGPLRPDERGIALFTLRTQGYRDAFVRRGGES